MNTKEINPAVAIAIGAVVLVIILVLGYKLFMAPPSVPETTPPAQYPGGHAPGASATP